MITKAEIIFRKVLFTQFYNQDKYVGAKQFVVDNPNNYKCTLRINKNL